MLSTAHTPKPFSMENLLTAANFKKQNKHMFVNQHVVHDLLVGKGHV